MAKSVPNMVRNGLGKEGATSEKHVVEPDLLTTNLGPKHVRICADRLGFLVFCMSELSRRFTKFCNSERVGLVPLTWAPGRPNVAGMQMSKKSCFDKAMSKKK